MKGISRDIDDLGRIVLPKEIRRSMNINTGDSINIIIDGDKIVLRPDKADGCAVCGKDRRNGKTYKGKFICSGCLLELSAMTTEG